MVSIQERRAGASGNGGHLLRRLLLATLLPGTAAANVGETHTIGPEVDWCDFINNEVLPGDQIFLLPGVYEGPCDWFAQEPAETDQMNMLQSSDPENPAVFTAPLGPDSVLAISGSHVGIHYVSFEGVPFDVISIRADDVQTVEIRHSRFVDVEGDAVQIRSASDLWVDDTEFIAVGRTAVRVGCQYEVDCTASDIRLTGLLIDGAAVGVVVNPGSDAHIIDGVYGPNENYAFTYVGERGVITGNLAWSPVVIEGETSIENNIFAAGLRLLTTEDISLRGNSIVGGIENFLTPDEYVFVANAVEGPLPDGEGNVSCADPDVCWEDVEGGDFRPAAGSELLTKPAESGLLTDFCGNDREVPGAVGALERTETSTPLVVDFKRLQACIPDPDPTVPDDDDDDEQAEESGKGGKGRGCACAAAAPSVGGMWVLALALLFVRRRTLV